MPLTPLKSLPQGAPKLPPSGLGKPLQSYPKSINFAPCSEVDKPETFAEKKIFVANGVGKPLPRRTTMPNLKPDPYTFHVGGVGAGFHEKGISGFDRKFSKYITEHRLKYGTLSKDDKKELHDIIEDRAKVKGIGSKFNFQDRKIMSNEALKYYKSGKISAEDLKKFKKIIETLEE